MYLGRVGLQRQNQIQYYICDDLNAYRGINNNTTDAYKNYHANYKQKWEKNAYKQLAST